MHTFIGRLKSSGFTIIELLVVIVVIGILAAIGIISYSGVQARALDRSVQSDADSLSGAETRYALNNGVGGKVWYSGVSGTNGVADSDLAFTPSKGNIVDVVVDNSTGSSAYCIRTFNPSSATYNTLTTAYKQESTPGVCATLQASDAVYTDTSTPLPAPFYSAGFESGLGDWSSGHANNVVSTSTTKVRTGSHSAKSVQNTFWYTNDAVHCGGPTQSCGFPGDGLRAVLTGVTVGHTYTLTAYVYTNDTNPRVANWYYVGHVSSTPVALTKGSWTKIQTTLTPVTTSPYIYLYIQTPANPPTDVLTTYIDDISLAY